MAIAFPRLSKRSELTAAILMVGMCLIMASVSPVRASGTLDPNFGSAGVARIDFGGPTTGNQDSLQGAAMQSDGKIIVSGRTYVQSQGDVSSQIALARLNTDGSLDTSFGTGGRVLTDLVGGKDQTWAIAIQPDGKIVVVGSTSANPPFNVMSALIRYNSNGGLDNTFGTGGVVYLDNALGQTFTVLALRGDGKILVADGLGRSFVLMQFTASGSLDTGFGSGGVLTKLCPFVCYPKSLAFQDDKLLVAGLMSAGNNYPFLVRLNSSGGLDFKFAQKGRAISGINRNSYFTAVLIQSDGNLAIGGTKLIRYDANGNLDRNFDLTTYVNFGPGGLAQMADGKIVATGVTDAPATNGFDLVTVIYGTGGNVLASVRTDLFGGDDLGGFVFVQPDGKIVVVGQTQTNTTTLNDFVVVRYSSITP